MTKKAIIERTVKAINQLPNDKAEEISDFVEFVIKKFDERSLINGIQKLATDGHSFNFLNEEENLYSITDIKEPYNG